MSVDRHSHLRAIWDPAKIVWATQIFAIDFDDSQISGRMKNDPLSKPESAPVFTGDRNLIWLKANYAVSSS